MSRCRRLAVGVALAWLSQGSIATAQAPPAGPRFPETLDRESLLNWVRRETDIAPSQVIAVTPPAVTALMSTFPASAGDGGRVVIRAEALSAETYARTGALSWHVSLTADCEHRRLKMGETTGYSERNLLGERRTLRPADSIWRAPEPGTALESAWRAACDPTFRGPLGDGGPITTAGSDAPFRKVLSAPNEPTDELTRPPKAQPVVAEPPRLVAHAPLVRKRAPNPVQVAKAATPPAVKGLLPARVMLATAPQPSPPGSAVAQLGAYSSATQAQAALSRLKPRLAGHGVRVETAAVDGRNWSRALVTGFADSAAASRFCATLKASNQGCLARTR